MLGLAHPSLTSDTPPLTTGSLARWRDAQYVMRAGDWSRLAMASQRAVTRSEYALTGLRMANVFDPQWDESQDRPPFSWRRARLGCQAGGRALGASLFELPPGASSFPLHIHHANEEMLIVLAGQPTLRTLDGERELAEGELVACPAGRAGAHRIDNRSDQPVRLLVVSTMIAPEVNEYPDSGKVWARTWPPGEPQPDDAVDLLVRPDQEPVDYLDGES